MLASLFLMELFLKMVVSGTGEFVDITLRKCSHFYPKMKFIAIHTYTVKFGYNSLSDLIICINEFDNKSIMFLA